MSKPILGFIDETQRTPEQQEVNHTILSAMPKYSMPSHFFGTTPPKGTKILLPDLWKAERITKALGLIFPGFWQLTGSCVGAGGGNAIFTTSCVDILKRGDQEKPIIPFWMHLYGISRQLANLRGKGEGSLGTTFAKAAINFGCFEYQENGLVLPSPKNTSAKGFCYSENAEMAWSDGASIGNNYRSVGKNHLIKTVTPVSSATEVRDGILNGYAFTRAGTFYVDYGTARVVDGVCLGSYNSNGGHQETWLGYWHHPTRGELIWEQNQWSADCYVADPGGGPRGGCWIPMDQVDKFCRHKYSEVFAWSQYEGYPEQPEVYDWATRPIIA